MGLLFCASKCCGCIALSQLYALLLPLGILAALGLFFYAYALPYSEKQIQQALNLTADVEIGNLNASYIAANSCSGCVFGSNTQWPTDTTGPLHFLDSKAGNTASGVIATALASAAVVGTGSMLWASAMPSATAALSSSGGFYEMTHIFEQAQFAGMISQLRIEGAPTFLMQFSVELSWTNFNLIKGSSDASRNSESDHNATRRLAESSSNVIGVVTEGGESGPARYATMIGVDADDLFYYTLVNFAGVIAALHVLYLVFVVIVSGISKKESFGEVARKWYRKIIWAGVLALLLAQYIFSMAGCYFISKGSPANSANRFTLRFMLGIVALVGVIFLALGLGVFVVAKNTDELKDIGTYEHDQRAFSSKYSAYYDEYNFDNRFFFVPRILLAVLTGAIVGIVHDAVVQLICILAIMLLYLTLLLSRQPNLLRVLYYMGIMSVGSKAILICFMFVLAKDDYFPQKVRDNVAYGIIGVNMLIFFLLFMRQAYMIIYKVVIACRHKNDGKINSDLNATDINLEFSNNMSNIPIYDEVEPTPSNQSVNWYANNQQKDQQEKLYSQQQHQAKSGTISSYTTQSSHSGLLENVPMLEPAPEGFSCSRSNVRPPISRNKKYSYGDLPLNAEVALASPTAAPRHVQEIPTYDVLATYLATGESASPMSARGQSFRSHHHSSRGQLSSRGQHSSRGQQSSSGLNSSRGLASSRGPSSSRGQSARRGTAMSVSSVSSRPSTVPLDEYVASFSGPGSSASSSRRQRSADLNAMRKDVDVDDVETDCVACNTYSLTSNCQQFDPSASGALTSSSLAMMQSYVNFSDSIVSSVSRKSTMEQKDNTFSSVMGVARAGKCGGYGSSPQAKTSIFSNDSNCSYDDESNNWFKHRSTAAFSTEDPEREMYEAEGQSYELGPFGVTKSAFSRDSVDSYDFHSTNKLATSHLVFSDKGGSDDGSFRLLNRRGTDSSNHSSNMLSNQSVLSTLSDDSFTYDVDKSRSASDYPNSLTF
ncbi:uncharacterized protein CCR75_005153 [Bremia lactucae]|uniref:TRP C-terminal domain-containing protein n=1 Tax=Bremia lactucae TaxID=4779 RepID=A0A976FPI8_BRELC|nr:hypothetical protein CCR75_005153 [Bremia lactucae]